MSTSLQHVSLLTPRVTPLNSRGAQLAASLFAGAAGLMARTFSAPAPRALTRGQEAEQVREMAWKVRHSDPGFSGDLYAAAARHEGLDD